MKCYAGVRGGVYELPAVIDAAKAYIRESGQSPNLYSGDMFSESAFPSDYNLHFYCNIFHIFSDQQCCMIGKKSFEAIPAGGHIMLLEIMLNDSETGPLDACLFNMHMFKCLPHARQFTTAGITEILESVGFVKVRVEYLFAGYSVVIGKMP